VTITGPRGAATGTITVALASGDRCSLTVDVSSPARPRRYTAVFDGTTAEVQGPALLLQAAPPPIGPLVGCALLMPHADGSDATVTRAAGTAHASNLRWKQRGHMIALSYGYSSPAAALPDQLTETVDGNTRLHVHFTSIAAKVFPISEFTVSTGGAQ
ncbi:MAG: hypothetical protein ACRDTS_11280, partial [Mycobacterium sp.]